MKFDKIAGSKNDEFYTPPYAIFPIIKYLELKKFVNILCPFDTEQSHFYKILRNEGFNVQISHKVSGVDFFDLKDFSSVDCVVSNPPYSIKGDVLYRLFSLDIPFMMLVGVVGLFESDKRFSMFESHEFELLYFNRRIAYLKSYEDAVPAIHPPFSSVYVCHGVLPKSICFERLTRK